MNNYYKYLPVSQLDEDWGIHVLNAGCNRIGKGEEYPSRLHPGHHYFKWSSGRILREYQLVYITNGSGYFESAHCKLREITEGTVFILFPGEWHRFRPHPSSGWDEYWVGFEGTILKKLFNNQFFKLTEPVLSVGMHEGILQLFISVIEGSKEEKAGYQPHVSGAVFHLLGNIYALQRQQAVHADDQTETIINRAKIKLRADIDSKLSLRELAKELQVSYSWFRQAFKAYTGMAPGQYLQQLKIEQAKLLLMDSSRSVKKVAYELNFKSAFYFSSLFSKKTGLSPEKYRKKLIELHKNKQ